MCGIVGILELGQRGAEYAVARAMEALCHRGPDDASLWRGSEGDTTVALGHRRLSILDLSPAGAQPMLRDDAGRTHPAREVSAPARLAIIFNGEIYNYVELRDELRALGHRFHTTGDTEVLLAAYDQWGGDCLERVNGMFALAIWDRERRRLFCARDRFGEKPFYYVLDPDGRSFAFASEVKALIAAGVVEPELDPRATYRFFRFGEQAGVSETVWRGIRKLMPARTLAVEAGDGRLRVIERQYWDVSIADTNPPSLSAAAERFGELFRESVRIRLRSDVPVGTSLSGGLDSSSVLCQIHALGAAAGQKAFTARMDDPALDEGRYVDLVLARTGVPGYSAVPTGEEFVRQLDQLAAHQEEPFTSTSVFASFLVHRLARTHGVTVMLDGQGADEYLAGYSHYVALHLASLARRGRWPHWYRERSAIRKNIGVDPVPLRAGVRYWMAGLRDSAGQTYVQIDGERDTAYVTPDVRRQFEHEEARGMVISGDPLKARLYVDLMHGHLQELLRYADRNSMAFSREVRLPFLDHRLVEFTLSLPASLLMGGGWSKRVLRAAMRDVVPPEILARRDKIGFMAPWSAWWTRADTAQSLRARLEDAREVVGELVDVERLAPGSGEALGVMSLAASQRKLCTIAASTKVTA